MEELLGEFGVDLPTVAILSVGGLLVLFIFLWMLGPLRLGKAGELGLLCASMPAE